MTLIKICGITSVKDAMEVAGLRVDMIGLVFAESSRRISRERACEITTALGELASRPAVAGVFVNEDPQTVNRIAQECRLDMVQLSGDESWGRCREIAYPVIKAVHITPSMQALDIIEHIKEGLEQAKRPLLCLLDSREGHKYGGTGRSFSREIAGEVSAALPVIIAGGLSPENVGGVIEKVRPLGVDVSSGVETGGLKDMAKINAFVKIVRSLANASSENRFY
ncbi:MAG: phosphoribosylanthranilate isomerase [Dehalococcoidia bacterium]